MPSVNWTIFEQLPGSTDVNFEMLCRALIRRHYGRYGDFASLASQPGVEFHLKLHSACSLGNPSRWYGWQCRWYDIPSGRAIGNVRRKKIEEAIRTTEKVLPELTDWVLWTRRSLTEGDQKWIMGLKTHMRLHLWTATDVEEHLSGDAVILRGTYFGELVLTPDSLKHLHFIHVAPIRRRWLPDVHQIVDAENSIYQMLGEAQAWGDLTDAIEQLKSDVLASENDLRDLVGSLADRTADVIQLANSMIMFLNSINNSLQSGDFDRIHEQLAKRPSLLNSNLLTLPRHLRNKNKAAALTVTNVLNETRNSYKLLDSLDESLNTRLVAVLANAGCGKTQLAAQITAGTDDRPAGIILHGRDLHAGQNLNNLARKIAINTQPVSSLDALIAAVDAAGQRAHKRLPIVIDGLNEAEDPRDWKGELASLDELLKQYPYVLVVCTLRPAFANDALPTDIRRLEIPDFGENTFDAIRKYFNHYRINALDADLPLELLKNPLTLRLFCDVTNPKRENEVGIEAMPGSLTTLFTRYLEQAAERITDLAPRTSRYYHQDVQIALDKIGLTLWEEYVRSLDESSLRQNLDDIGRPWNESIIRALVDEGVILRIPGKIPGSLQITGVYDALAGYLVARALIPRNDVDKWLQNANTIAAFSGSFSTQHPLSTDIFNALVGLIPQIYRQKQLWMLVDEPLRTTALRQAAELEGVNLDGRTIEELAKLLFQSPTYQSDLFDRLWQTRGSPAHPLNAEFLDRTLRQMTVADRDIRWTEWIRRNDARFLNDLRRLEKRWRDNKKRTKADILRAKWVMWTLTSTIRELRDQATRTLYWFGRGNPAVLFDLTVDSLSINDFYVSERMLAASYGIAMAHQLPDPEFSQSISVYLAKLRENLMGPNATNPTNHWLGRLYVEETILLVDTYHQGAVPDGLIVNGQVLFTPGPVVEFISKTDPRSLDVDQTLGMDFENYTVGRLFNNRRNYDMEHKGHQTAIAYIRGVIWTLGWRTDKFGEIEKILIRYSVSRSEQAKIERYGKKYCWIGYYLYAGLLVDQEHSPDNERLPDLQIDPSFPEPPPNAPIECPIWVHSTPANDKSWLRHGNIEIPNELLYRSNFDSIQGPWIAVNGFLNQEISQREVFGFLAALIVEKVDADRLIKALNGFNSPTDGRLRLPETPNNYYTFAGEIPWNPEFSRNYDGNDSLDLYRTSINLEDNEKPVQIEILASSYSWESFHSAINQAGSVVVPSKPFSTMFDLRGMAQSFNQLLPDGSIAALSFGAPTGFTGNLLYLREDLVCQYIAGRELVWFMWGERRLKSNSYPVPDWLAKIQWAGEDIWRYIGKFKPTLRPR